MARPKLFLIDSFGFIFRAYHARARSGAPPMRTTTGISTEAVYIFHNMLRKLLTAHKPEYIAAIFESSGPTFRSESFAEYKANRTEMPEDLRRADRVRPKAAGRHAHPHPRISRLRGGRRDRHDRSRRRGGRRGGRGHRFERQGHAATGDGPRLDAESDEGRHLV